MICAMISRDRHPIPAGAPGNVAGICRPVGFSRCLKNPIRYKNRSHLRNDRSGGQVSGPPETASHPLGQCLHHRFAILLKRYDIFCAERFGRFLFLDFLGSAKRTSQVLGPCVIAHGSATSLATEMVCDPVHVNSRFGVVAFLFCRFRSAIRAEQVVGVQLPTACVTAKDQFPHHWSRIRIRIGKIGWGDHESSQNQLNKIPNKITVKMMMISRTTRPPIKATILCLESGLSPQALPVCPFTKKR